MCVKLHGLNSYVPVTSTNDVTGERPVDKPDGGQRPEPGVVPQDELPEVPQKPQLGPNPVGAYETYLDGTRDVETGEGKLYKTQTIEDKIELIGDAVDGFVKKMLDDGRSDEIEALARKIDEREAAGAEPAEVKDLRDQLENLRAASDKVLCQRRDKMFQYVLVANNFLKFTLQECKSRQDMPPEERQATLKKALTQLRRDIRKFRFEYDRHFELGVFGKTSGIFNWARIRRKFDNFFTTSRKNHRLLERVIEKDQALVDDFTAQADALREKLGLDLRGKDGAGSFAFGHGAEAFSRELHDINSYVRGVDLENDRDGIVFTSVKSQLKDMAREGGTRTLGVAIGLGGGIKVGPIDARILGKGQFQYRITCDGSGTVQVEQFLGGGIEGRANVRVPGVLEGAAYAEGGVQSLRNGLKFKSVDDAARYISRSSLMAVGTPLFVTGSISTAVTSWLKKLFTRSENIFTNDRFFVEDLKSRGILNKMAQHILPDRNVVVVEETVEGVEKGGGVGGDAKFQAGPVRLEAGIDRTWTRHEGVVKGAKPYLSSLEFDFAGEATKRVGDGIDLGKTPMIVAQEEVDAIRAVVADVQAKPGDVIGRLKELKDKIDAYASGAGAKDARANQESVARRYRNTAILAVVLFEKWKALAGAAAATPDEKAAYDKLSGIVREALVHPAVEFSKNVFKNILQVSSGARRDNYSTVRTRVRFSYDLNGPAGGIVESLVHNSAGADALTEGVGTSTGLVANGIEAEYITRTNTDRGGSPWKARETTTINVRTGPDCLLVDAILFPIARHLAQGSGQPAPETREAALNIVKDTASASGVAWLKGLFLGKSEDDVVGQQSSPWYAAGWNVDSSGRNVQIKFEDGRLRSISIGDQSRSDVRYDVGQFVVAELGYTMNSVVNRNTHWIHPSFHSVVAKCESYIRVGNSSDWTVFALQNREVLARFDGIVRAVERDRSEDLGGDDLKDGEQFRVLRDEIDKADFSRFDERRREALERNRAVFHRTLAAIRDADGGKRDLDRELRVKTLLECVVRHYSLTNGL